MMKRLIVILFITFSTLLTGMDLQEGLTRCSQSSVYISVNSGVYSWLDCSKSSVENDFNGFTFSNVLSLKIGGECYSFNADGDEAKLYWQIKDGSGTIKDSGIVDLALIETIFDNDHWQETTNTVEVIDENILSPSETYYLHVWFYAADKDFNPAIEILDNNNGSNYVATITTDASLPVHNSLIYVSTTGNDTGSIGIESSPFASIQSAIDYSQNGDTVLVQPGPYVENITFNGKNIVVGSLFLTTGDTSYISQTIIDGNQNGSVVTFNSGEDSLSLLSGFTIKNGATDFGGGIYIDLCSPRLEYLRIANNTAYNRGGGLYLRHSNSFISNIVVKSNNATTNFGGGIYTSDSNPLLLNVRITNNNTNGYGGGVYCSNSDIIIHNALIDNNTASLGFGGACFDYNSDPILSNLTIVDNNGAIFCENNSKIIIINSIIYNNDNSPIILSDNLTPCSLNISYSNIQYAESSITYNIGTVTWGKGNFDLDPIFKNATIRDYHINNYSPCIGAGLDTSIVPIVDLDGNPRPNPAGSNPDMGAYENPLGAPLHIPITLNVPSEYSTIHEALNTALEGDTILVQPGIYYGNLVWPEINGIKLISAGDSSNTFIDGGGNGNVILINPQNIVVDTTTKIIGFNIRNGANVNYGGGIYIEDASVVISESNINNCSAYIGGGGICINNSSCTIKNTLFNGNTSASLGGGIYMEGSSPSLSKIKISGNNSTDKGGGLYTSQSSPVGINIIVTNNESNNGGGLYSDNSDSDFMGMSLNNNIAQNQGGGVFLSNSTSIFDSIIISSNNAIRGGGIAISGATSPSISNLTITENNVTDDGGGVFVTNNASPSLNEVIVSLNHADDKGGGIFLENGNPLINKLTVTENTCGSDGGGICIYESQGNVSCLQINNNIAHRGGGIFIIHCSPNITDGVIFDNTANYHGGGVFMETATPKLNSIRIFNNSSVEGGGLFLENSSPNLTNIEVLNNRASQNGGGIYCLLGKPTPMTDVNICNNIAGSGGGIYFYYSSSLTVSNATVADNFAVNGGGLYFEDCSPTISNFTITSNDANNGPGLYIQSGSPIISNSNFLDNNVAIYNINNINYPEAANNYWGHESGPYHVSQNPSGKGDSIMTFGNVVPWLTIPNTSAPPIPIQNLRVVDYNNNEITLSWSASELTDLASYRIYYNADRTDLFNYTDSVDVTSTDTTVIIQDLSLGNTYYFTGVIIDDDANMSWYSNEVVGTTRVLEVQNLEIKDENITHLIGHTPYISFEYYDSANEAQTGYQIQVSTLSDFSNPDMWDTGVIENSDTSITYAGNPLVDGQTYYLKVKVASGEFWSDWSSMTFRMNSVPVAPDCVSPVNFITVGGLSEYLKAYNSTDPDGDVLTYIFDVYNFDGLKVDSSENIPENNMSNIWPEDVGTTSWQTSILNDNSVYSWTVRAFDGYEISEPGNGTFVVNSANDPPYPTIIVSPKNNSTITSLVPQLDWWNCDDPDPFDQLTYTVQIGKSFTNMESIDVNDNVYQITKPLEDNSLYYWKVIARDKAGATTENDSGFYSFKVNTQNDNPNGFALIYPEDSSMVTTHTPTFYWQIAEDIDPLKSSLPGNDVVKIDKTNKKTMADSKISPVNPVNYAITDYLFYISDSNDFMGITPISLDTNVYPLETSLREDQVYYWKVEAVDNLGGVTSSAVWSFWTNKENSTPGEFTLLTPFGSTAAVTPSFTWTQSSDNDLQDTLNYLLKYGPSPYDLINIPTGNQTQYVPEEPLRDNTEYIWQVSARDISGAVFTTPFLGFFVNTANDNPEQFTQIFPDSNEIITSQNPLMFWNITTDVDYHAVKYVLYLGTNTQTMAALDTVDVNYYRPVELTDGVYYWKVTAIDYYGGEQNTSIWPFTVNAHNEPPGEFALLSPLSDSVFTTLTPTLQWHSAIDNDENDTVSYEIEYSKTMDSISIINTGSNTLYTFENPLEDNSLYYWKVIAKDISGATAMNTCGFQRFAINTANDFPEAFQLLSPDSVVVLSQDCNLRWTPAHDPDPFDKVHYDLHWFEKEVDMNYAAIDTNNYYVADLYENAMYNWFVVGLDMHNGYSQSDTATFWVDAVPEPPTTFATISPANESAGLGSEVVFSWQESVDPDPFDMVEYEMVYTLNTVDSTTYEYVSELADTTVTLNMTENGVYYWKVRAKDNDQFITPSNNDEWHVFTVGNVAIDGGLLIPEEFALHSNFPNPFNPTTTIRYDIPKASNVTLTIYNMNGQVVERLVSQKQEPGFYTVNWDARNVSTGVYFYQIRAEGFQQVKKCLLIK